MGIILGLVKGAVGGLGMATLQGGLLIVKSMATPQIMAEVLINILDWYAASTATTVDDAGVAKVKKVMKENGILK